jgi:Alpha/beta hydrolase domain
MEWNLRSLDVVGYKDQPVPNTFIVQPNPTRHLGIVLPGYRYSPEMAPLYYAGRILLEGGADLMRIEYTYYRTDFPKQPESEQDKWISGDVFAACEAAFSQRAYEKITLIGKSMGTLAMAQLLVDPRFQRATCVWLTPLLTVERLSSRIEQIHPRSLFIIGTADQFYKPDILERLEQSTGGRSLVLEGANHGLEIPGDIPRSLAALEQIVQALQEFLREDESKA